MTPAQKRAREARAAAARAQSGRAEPKQDSSAPSQRPRRSRALHSRIWSEKIIPAVLRRDCGICHACYAMGCQATGADSADHDPVPLSACEARGIQPFDMSNLKAIHHKKCQWCGVACNVVKGNLDLGVFKVEWERITGRQAVDPMSSPSPADDPDRW
jgi:hypothetical protein